MVEKVKQKKQKEIEEISHLRKKSMALAEVVAFFTIHRNGWVLKMLEPSSEDVVIDALDNCAAGLVMRFVAGSKRCRKNTRLEMKQRVAEMMDTMDEDAMRDAVRAIEKMWRGV